MWPREKTEEGLPQVQLDEDIRVIFQLGFPSFTRRAHLQDSERAKLTSHGASTQTRMTDQQQITRKF